MAIGGNSTSGAGIRLAPNDVLRFLLELFALFSLGYWGYLAWPFPWPAVAFMIGAPLFAAIVWGLFRSPKAKFPLDPVGRVIVEAAIMGSAALAWWMLDAPIVAVAFAVIALVSGIINLRSELRREHEHARAHTDARSEPAS